VDEANCDPETYFLCGQSHGGSVDYFACLDASTASTPEAKAKECAAANTPALDFDKIQSCFSGAEAQALLKAASQYFDGKFPNPVGVPNIAINGVDVGKDRSYATILKELCAKGIKAGACSKSTVDLLII